MNVLFRKIIIHALICMVLTISANAAPVANDDSVTTEKDIPGAITLTTSGADEASLAYTIVDQPISGTLSGTAPDLTYTPNYHFSGSDSFTFKVDDINGQSNTATVSITVEGVQVIDYTAPTPGTVKTYKIALLMLNTVTETNHVPDNPISPRLEFYSPEQLGQIYFEHEHGAAAFLHEASYGKIAIEGRVVGWIDEPTAGLNGTDISGGNRDYYLSLFDDYLTHSDYDIFVVHSLVEGGGQQTGWLYPHQSFTSATQGPVSGIGIDWMANSGVFDFAPLNYSNWSSAESVLPTTSWAHEMLHTLGITGHANSYDCGTVTLSTDGTIKGYGDSFSIMGEYAWATHPNALMKSRIGWLEPAQLPDITTNGTYDIYPLVAADGQTKAMVIPLDPPLINTPTSSEFDAIVIEYRTATGFDRYLQRLDGSTFLSQYTSLTDIDRNGVLVYLRYSNTGTDSTALLDMNPTTTYKTRGIKWPGNAGKFADAILPVNQTFTWNGIAITPLGTTPGGAMQVSVIFNAPPVITSEAWADPTTITLSQTTTLNVVANDTDPLTYTWGKVTGPGTPTFDANNGTAQGDGVVTSFDTPGDYEMEVVVTDGATTVTSQCTVTVSNTVDTAYIFYNNSAWDGDAGASPADDDAIAIDKAALLPGNSATFGNYTSYDKGINGIMIDVSGTLPTTLDPATNFTFKVGNNNTPSGWATLTGTELPSVTVTPDVDTGIDRITIIWDDADAPKNTWLQVTVLASGNVGLTDDYVFYYGNAIGEVGNSETDALVNASDALGMRANPQSIGGADVENLYDCNRDKAVNATDVLRARSNATTTSTALQLITP